MGLLMAEHVWSVLCRKAVVDRYEGQVSLHEVIEQVVYRGSEEELLDEIEKGVLGLIQASMQLVTWWVRSDFDTPETTSRVRISLADPSGDVLPHPRNADKEMSIESPIDLEEKTARRILVSFDGIPFSGFGTYRFVVEGKSEDDDEWKLATRIPLQVRAAAPQEKASQE